MSRVRIFSIVAIAFVMVFAAGADDVAKPKWPTLTMSYLEPSEAAPFAAAVDRFAFTRTNNLGLPVRGNPPGDELAYEEDNRQDMVFVRIPGETVCDFEHTLTRYQAQLAAAEIDIPRKVEKERLKFLKARFKAVCGDDDD